MPRFSRAVQTDQPTSGSAQRGAEPRPDTRPAGEPLPACFAAERSPGSEWCEQCKAETPLVEAQCGAACAARSAREAAGRCGQFGHFDATRYQCVQCWRSRPGASKAECQAITARRLAEAEAVRTAGKVGEAELERAAEAHRQQLREFREGLTPEGLAELQARAEEELVGFMRSKFLRERAVGELQPTTRAALAVELDRLTEARMRGVESPQISQITQMGPETGQEM